MKYWKEKLICKWKGHDFFKFDPVIINIPNMYSREFWTKCLRCGNLEGHAVVFYPQDNTHDIIILA